jgi:hypothetical protein
VSGWCFRRNWSCQDASASEISNFKSLLKTCIQAAVDIGFVDVFVLPHNDIRGGWHPQLPEALVGWETCT